jgi:hypothetical protein
MQFILKESTNSKLPMVLFNLLALLYYLELSEKYSIIVLADTFIFFYLSGNTFIVSQWIVTLIVLL